MGFEIGLVAHLPDFLYPVTKVNEFYVFLKAKVNKVGDIEGSGASFSFIRVKVEKNNIEP